MNDKDKATAETARMTKYYRTEYASLIGRKVVDVRSMYPEEMELLMWGNSNGGPGNSIPGSVLILDDGGLVLPMRDEEGNGKGALMVQEGKR